VLQKFLRADRHVSPEFVLSGQVGDLEPELPVDGCLHGGVGGADDVSQVAEADDEGSDVVFGEPAAGLWGSITEFGLGGLPGWDHR